MTGASSWLDGHDQRRIVPGLERISALAERLGNPQNKFKSIHVAGSDGKGSVCAMVYSVLRTSGIRTGSFSSPFIEDRTESISVDGRNISSEDLESVLEEVREADRGIGRIILAGKAHYDRNPAYEHHGRHGCLQASHELEEIESVTQQEYRQ